MRKCTAFIVGVSVISVFGIIAFVFPGKSEDLRIIINGVVALGSAYIGLQVVNNGVKGKFFNPDLHNAENHREVMQ